MYTPGFARKDNQADRQYLADWRGSTRYVTDSAGAVRGEARYDAYGQQMAGSALGTPHQFAGGWGYEREENSALGLDYLYQRYYDPAAGRFISRDPIGWAGGLNLYGYCDNDPINAVDPSGLSPESWGESIWKAPFRALMALFGDCKFRPDAPSFRNANSFYGPHLRRAGAEIYQFTEDQGSGITNQVLLGGLQMGMVGGGAVKCVGWRGGRLGGFRTRVQNNLIATELENRGWRVIRGAGRGKEEFIPRGPGRPQGTYVDITAVRNGRTLRVQTVDTLSSGQPTSRELAAAARIRHFQQSRDHLILIPKR